MTKNEYGLNFPYAYDPARKGAKYTLDDVHWMNNGEFAEVVAKAVRGYMLAKDANTRYDEGSDIEETKTSVKSGKATLTSVVLGNNKQEVLNTYFATVHSTNWDWVIIIDDMAIIYNMNAEEFREFCEEWASYDEHRKVVRFKATSGKMIKWLEERL